MNVTSPKLKTKALAVLAQTGDVVAAAKAGRVSKRTVERWKKASDPGIAAADAVLADDKNQKLRETLRETAQLAADQLKTQIKEGKIKGTQLAITLGILVDKARLLDPPKEQNDQGDLLVAVKFGGMRVREIGKPEDPDGEEREAEAGVVEVRARRGA